MAVFDEQAVQLGESRHRRAWRTQSECSAGGLVQHPASDSENDAVAHLHVYKLASGAALAVHATQATAVQRMPTVEDLNFLPDMGRMNRNWRTGGSRSHSRCYPACFELALPLARSSGGGVRSAHRDRGDGSMCLRAGRH